LFFDDDAVFKIDVLTLIKTRLLQDQDKQIIYYGTVLNFEDDTPYITRSRATTEQLGFFNFDTVCSIGLLFNREVLEEIGFFAEDFGVGILKAAVSWLTKGQKVLRAYDEINYQFACLSDTKTFQVFDTFYEQPVVRIKTVNEDEVFICKANESFSELDLLSHTSKIQQDISLNNIQEKYESVTFPCLKIKDEPDISWLKGLLLKSNKPNSDYLVSSAKQQTKFEMDENGAKVESAAAVVMVRSCRVLKHLVIDDSAHVWISRKNCKVPYFAARVEKDSWVKAT
jgi:hypothetical protein